MILSCIRMVTVVWIKGGSNYVQMVLSELKLSERESLLEKRDFESEIKNQKWGF